MTGIELEESEWNRRRAIEQWLSAFLMLQTFNAVTCVVVTPNLKITFIATAMNNNVQNDLR